MIEYFIKPIVKTFILKGQEGQSIKEITKSSRKRKQIIIQALIAPF